ncbi:MAG: hypothetical protein ACK2UY_07565 [Anaerolineae bacterium]
MKQLELRYVAHVTTLSNCLLESYQTTAASMRELVAELDGAYPGFRQMFENPETGTLSLNAMIYYGAPGQVPISVIDLDQRIDDGGTVTFW